MFDDRYKYTQVPSPLVQPGGARRLFDLGGTTVIGEEPDACCEARPHEARSGGTAPKAHKSHASQKRVVSTNSSAPKKKRPVSIVAIIIAIIFVSQLALAGFAYVATAASEYFDNLEQNIDQAFDELFEDESTPTIDEEVFEHAEARSMGEISEAFIGEDDVVYYYAPDVDMFIGAEEEPVDYYHISRGYYNTKGERISTPAEAIDSDYAELAKSVD